MIEIGKAINGISLNGNEWLLNNDATETLKFDNRDEAIKFLRANGYENFKDADMENSFIFQEVQD
jgi:hypothetical protein